MTAIQNGVSEKSSMFFFPNCNNSLYYYPVSVGHFYCNSDYLVKRDTFDSLLILSVIRGSFSFIINGEERVAKSGKLAIVNCFEPHTYFTNDSFEAYWVHISGSNTKEFYYEILAKYGDVLCSATVENQVKEIYNLAKSKEPVTEGDLSFKIYHILISLLNLTNNSNKTNAATKAIRYMTENFHSQLSVDDIAAYVGLSNSQFSRQFKTQIGTSPYDYLLSIRLTKAKELLKNTNLPISEIAYQTGFTSDSNFIYFFKKQENISPLKFRNTLY